MPAFRKLFFSLSVMMITFLVMTATAFGAAEKTGIISEEAVNFRANPNITAKILNQLAKGTKVSVLDSEGDWYKVSYSDATGWINVDFLTVRDEKIAMGVVSENTVNVRSKADISSEILTKLNKGTKVDIFERTGNWYRISIGEERFGWIHRDFVTVKNETVSRGVEESQAIIEVPDEEPEIDVNMDVRQQIVVNAKALLGVKYVYGGSTVKGFDCSGFVSYVFKKSGVTLERSSRDMGNEGTAVKKGDLQPGDLVFFDTNGGLNGINHVGIYIGSSKFIHASSSLGRKVTISSLNDGYYAKTYMRARDYLS